MFAAESPRGKAITYFSSCPREDLYRALGALIRRNAVGRMQCAS
jgi:hypothetical protein